MNLTELKKKKVSELLTLAKEMKIDSVGRAQKQDVIFAILKAHARSG
ncbi:MAG TPA: transcription termination factor Rho, partial [Chromatiales bacterium]|nr:transcription termination factor Rho [Chromatiales bacterium]